ncbi:di-trans,poly-cis-decaprenylcistransferase [Candidatus Woesearchaeota archaeon]|nr:di-trans,poly-cis-decaprenylcistransferase [Candidatus Woesearchaeota archaeon]
MSDGPKHVGFILDGNRRYARRLAMQPWKGHDAGLEKVKKVLKWCKELDINEVTLYSLSMQNLKRSKGEVDYLMRLFLKAFKDLKESDDPDKERTRVRVIGRLALLPEAVRREARELMEKTRDNEPYTLNIAAAYGGREEVTDAVKEIASLVKGGELAPEEIDVPVITDHLYLQSEPDMIVRTSGEYRTSNFLVWQSWYSEWFFPKKFWPEIEQEDLVAMVEEFKKRERRFGK